MNRRRREEIGRIPCGSCHHRWAAHSSVGAVGCMVCWCPELPAHLWRRPRPNPFMLGLCGSSALVDLSAYALLHHWWLAMLGAFNAALCIAHLASVSHFQREWDRLCQAAADLKARNIRLLDDGRW